MITGKSEIVAFELPKWKVGEVEKTINGNVEFYMNYGKTHLLVGIKADLKNDSVCCSQNGNVEYAKDEDFIKCVVDTETICKIIDGDMEYLKEGFEFILNDTQVYELNEKLAYYAHAELDKLLNVN